MVVPWQFPPATAWAEGAQLNGRPFPATASAEGAQLNVPPSLCHVSGKKGTRSTGWKVKGLIQHTGKFFACAWPASRKQARAAKRCGHPKRQASTIVMGDVRNVAAGVNHGARNNQQISGWNHGKIRTYVEYKAQAEGIRVMLQNEHYTSQTCPQCGHRHKPCGRVYICGQCGFSGHRDVVGQINTLSAYTTGTPGKLPTPAVVKHRMPHNLRLMRRRRDTGQVLNTCSLENSHA